MNDRSTVTLIRKDSGVTSFSSLRYVKKHVNKKTGHCGTLDKFATGLLIACCGKYTKKVPLFMGLDKEYVAVIEFGTETDTLDPEGKIIERASVPSFETIRKNVEMMTGTVMQAPPAYSALHVDGKRSYELARKGLVVQPEKRPVVIHRAEILNWSSPYLTVRLNVSKGTYVRSYARDLGLACGSRGYVTALERTKIGPFSVSEAVLWNDAESLENLDSDTADALLSRLEDCTK